MGAHKIFNLENFLNYGIIARLIYWTKHVVNGN